jgi:hypothetical protein
MGKWLSYSEHPKHMESALYLSANAIHWNRLDKIERAHKSGLKGRGFSRAAKRPKNPDL